MKKNSDLFYSPYYIFALSVEPLAVRHWMTPLMRSRAILQVMATLFALMTITGPK